MDIYSFDWGGRLDNLVVRYQKAFAKVINRLKAKDSVLAVMVFGSMVTGDIWEESDIDLFVITKDEPNMIKNIYTEEKAVPIHMKLMSKEVFLQLHENDLRGGFIHRIFASSKLVFSKDASVTNRYNDGRYYPDMDRERWNVVYLGNVLKLLGGCKKYLMSGRQLSAYSICIACVEEYAKLYINFSGHMISNDAMSMCMNLDSEFKRCIENLFDKSKSMEASIEDIITFITFQVDIHIKNMANFLIKHLEDSKKKLSAEDIKADGMFKGLDVEIEEILSELSKKNIIKKDFRDHRHISGEILVKEKVYYI